MLNFSTDDGSDNDAFARWRAAICDHFVPLRPEPSASVKESSGAVRSWSLGELTLSTINVAGQRIHRAKPEISRSDREVFFVTVHLVGEMGLTCDEDRKLIRSGDIYVVDARRPFLLHCESRGRGVSLTIPRRAARGRLASLENWHGLVKTPDDAISGLLRDYLRSLAAADGNLDNIERENVATHLTELVGHVLARNEGGAPPPRQTALAALFARACRLIDRRLHDPDFDPASLAKDTGVSLRQLQIVFSTQDTSPMRAIFERRITLAKRMLLDPAHEGKSITQIAFECGFRDLSHFGRTFANVTGSTPRAWRRRDGISA